MCLNVSVVPLRSVCDFGTIVGHRLPPRCCNRFVFVDKYQFETLLKHIIQRSDLFLSFFCSGPLCAAVCVLLLFAAQEETQQ